MTFPNVKSDEHTCPAGFDALRSKCPLISGLASAIPAPTSLPGVAGETSAPQPGAYLGLSLTRPLLQL